MFIADPIASYIRSSMGKYVGKFNTGMSIIELDRNPWAHHRNWSVFLDYRHVHTAADFHGQSPPTAAADSVSYSVIDI